MDILDISLLAVLGLMVGWVAVPAMRSLGYRYGRFGRTRDILLVVGGTLLAGIGFTLLLGLIGAAVGGRVAVIALGALGALTAITVLTIFSAGEASKEEQLKT